MKLELYNYDVALGHTSIAVEAIEGDRSMEFWWSPDDGIVLEEYEGHNWDKFTEEERDEIRKRAAVIHELTFRGSDYWKPNRKSYKDVVHI